MKSYSDNTVERTRSGTRPPTEKELDSFDKVGYSLLCYVHYECTKLMLL